MRVFLLLALCLWCSCRKASDATQLVSRTKQVLAEREKRLTSYRVEVESRSGQVKALHRFAFRSPNFMAGELLAPEPLSVSFDGSHLWKLLPKTKTRVDYTVALSQAQAAFLLAQTFSPFIPEGFRTPLLPTRGVTAKRVAHPLEPQAIELTVSQPDAEIPVSTVFVLRESTGDFLAKRIEMGTSSVETTVVAEQCETALNLCVPTKLIERQGGEQIAVTEMTRVELNLALANDGFALVAPEGYVTERRELTETSSQL